MNKYDIEWEDTVKAPEPDVDPRVRAVQRMVDMEQAFRSVQQDLKERQMKAAALSDELEKVRAELRELLGGLS